MTRITLDGFQLFAAIGSHRELFADAEVAVDKAAAAILLGRIKSKHMTLRYAHRIMEAVGAEHFEISLDHLNDNELRKLVKKIDPHCSDASASKPRQLRDRVIELVHDRAEPAAKPETATRSPRRRKVTPNEEAAWPTSMTARPKRRG